MDTLILLLAAGGLAALLGRRRVRPAQWWSEPLWATGCGLVFAAISTWITAPLLMEQSICMPDFSEYCQGILQLHGAVDIFPSKRSRLAAWLPATLARQHGILDGLAWAGVISAGVMGAALYAWGRVLGGRAAGLMAVAAGMAMAPLAGLPRFLAYYPELSAGLTMAAAATAAAMARPGLIRMTLAGAGIGLCLLLDVRGLVWALPYLGGLLLAGLSAPVDSRRRVLLLVAGLVPLWLSWFGGWSAYTAFSAPLEAQLDIRPLFYAHGVRDASFLPPYEYSSGLIWGWTSPAELLGTIRFLIEQRALGETVPVPFTPPSGVMLDHHQRWWGALLTCSAVAGIGLLRRPRVLLALAATVLPFAVSFHSIGDAAELSARFYAHALPGVAVVMGVAVGAVVTLTPRLPWSGPPPVLRGLAVAGIGLALVMGWLPTWLSVTAAWREPVYCYDGVREMLVEAREERTMMGTCARAIYGDDSTAELPITVFDAPPWQ
ncbi:MAG: hypothetical protein P8R54_01145 [Myxococcota bacterium]|nr:hypothetical protein [Myxococcota bacterium]